MQHSAQCDNENLRPIFAMNTKKKSKTIEDFRNALWRLTVDAERVSGKYGVIDDAGTPSDWQEWIDLRRAIQNANYLLKKHP